MNSNSEITPRFMTTPGKKLVGIRLSMSLAANRTGELWQNLMPRRKNIANRVGADLISMSVYPTDYFTRFKPDKPFEKWAAVEVNEFKHVPDGMETFELPGGLYAVFHYQGPGNDPSIFSHIFGSWLPASGFIIDDRPHFEILGENYKVMDPNAEEEIWIPVKPSMK